MTKSPVWRASKQIHTAVQKKPIYIADCEICRGNAVFLRIMRCCGGIQYTIDHIYWADFASKFFIFSWFIHPVMVFLCANNVVTIFSPPRIDRGSNRCPRCTRRKVKRLAPVESSEGEEWFGWIFKYKHDTKLWQNIVLMISYLFELQNKEGK